MTTQNPYMGAKDAVPLPWNPTPPSRLTGNTLESLRADLDTLKATVDTLVDLTPQVSTAPPQRPRRGTIRYAVAPWNPLGSGDAWVWFNGSAWVAL